jgi:predicted metal-dependent phosphoesterase TrpH
LYPDADSPGMVYADLHVHTDHSDGTLALEAVPDAAERAGVDVVALTDHDRFQPALDAPVTVRDGTTVVHAIELRVETASQRLDLLGYGVTPTSDLEALVEHLQRDRTTRGQRIIENVEERLGVSLDLEGEPGLGRPDIARAVDAHPDCEYDYEETFEHLIGDDGPCFVARDVPTFEAGRAVLADACAFVGLAHPLRYADPKSALSLCSDLDAVERHYPYSQDVDPGLVDDAIAEHDLLATGGSDAHDHELAVAGLSREAYEPIANALPEPE